MEKFFIITDYNHLPDDLSTSWVPKYAERYLIYDRADRWQENENIKKQVNVGENIYDMADFIVTNYENLPEIMIFTKADVIPRHCSEEKFSKIINNRHYTPIENYSRNTNGFFPGAYSFVDEQDGYWEHSREINYLLSHLMPHKFFSSYKDFFYEVFENPVFTEYIRFSPGGNHLIPKKDILRYNKSFYEVIKKITSWEIRPGEAFIIERALNTLFTNSFTIKEKYRG